MGVEAQRPGTAAELVVYSTRLGAKQLLADDRQALSLATLRSARKGERLHGEALVLRSEIRSDKNGRPYAAFTVKGVDGGSIECRWWNYPLAGNAGPEAGRVYLLSGTVDIFSGNRQLSVVDATLVADADLTIFARSTRRSLDELTAELEECIGDLEPDLAMLVNAVLSGETYERFRTWPAAQACHGAVRHGLLAHSIRVAVLARQMAEGYGPDGLRCDMNIVTTACLLHDVGKVYTLPAIAGAALPTQAEHFDHATLSVLMLRAAAERMEAPIEPERLNAVLHAILAHHGRREWGAAIEPRTVEAWLVHLADYAESRLWPVSEEEAE